jgi:hypothetical protein
MMQMGFAEVLNPSYAFRSAAYPTTGIRLSTSLENAIASFFFAVAEGCMPVFKLPLSGDVVQNISPFTAFMSPIGSQFGVAGPRIVVAAST